MNRLDTDNGGKRKQRGNKDTGEARAEGPQGGGTSASLVSEDAGQGPF